MRRHIDIHDLPSTSKNFHMKKIIDVISKLGKQELSILISGESGVGKEVFAKYIHDISPRKSQKFVGLNCSSIPDSLLEAELFGAEKGAYTGADNRQIGKFELAQHGTLLLDEISEMNINLQAKLLRVIQEKELYRIGGSEKVDLDVRLISTTNRNIQDWVREGGFREDLYYRLNVISIYIPSLRERPEDILYLANYFIQSFNLEHNKSLILTSEAKEQLEKYRWPGNVRELKNMIMRSCFMADGNQINRIPFDNWSQQHMQNLQTIPIQGTIQQMEKYMIYEALKVNSGNRIKTSSQLGISVRTLRNKLKAYKEDQNEMTLQ